MRNMKRGSQEPLETRFHIECAHGTPGTIRFKRMWKPFQAASDFPWNLGVRGKTGKCLGENWRRGIANNYCRLCAQIVMLEGTSCGHFKKREIIHGYGSVLPQDLVCPPLKNVNYPNNFPEMLACGNIVTLVLMIKHFCTSGSQLH